MNSREIVRRTLDYEYPERVARSFGESDFVGAGPTVQTPATGWKEVGGGRWERTDEWGNAWGRVDATSKGEVVRGVLEDWADLDRLELPDYSRPEDYERVREVRAAHPDKWLNGGMAGFAFNIGRKMRRMDQYLEDILLEPERISELHDRIDALIEDMIRNYAAAGVDGVMFGEDWGTQDRLLVSPGTWRREFGPRFESLCAVARECGVRVFMHSCGYVCDIVPPCMEAGIDVFQFDQPELHGLGQLAAHQDRKAVTFWCPVDIQTTLQSGDEELIRARCREMLDLLWRGRGGFIAGFYGDNASIGLDPRWQEIACDEFLRCGVGDAFATVFAEAQGSVP